MCVSRCESVFTACCAVGFSASLLTRAVCVLSQAVRICIRFGSEPESSGWGLPVSVILLLLSFSMFKMMVLNQRPYN